MRTDASCMQQEIIERATGWGCNAVFNNLTAGQRQFPRSDWIQRPGLHLRQDSHSWQVVIRFTMDQTQTI